MYMKKHRRKPGQAIFSKRARSICNLHSCYNFVLVLYENTLVFSQSGARNFFMYIIVMITTANSSKWLIKQGYSFPKYYRQYACKTFSTVITKKTSIYPTQRPNRAESGNRVQKVEIKLSINNSRKYKKQNGGRRRRRVLRTEHSTKHKKLAKYLDVLGTKMDITIEMKCRNRRP